MRHISYLFLLTFIFLGLISCKEDKYPGPLSPEESIKTFDLHDDFEIEVFASEPHIVDPVDLVFDERGNAYAIEMPDYPYKPEPGEGRGIIKKLTDSDGDGRVDQSSSFAEGIPDATSLMPWKGGLLVTSAPHIYYLKDTDGDGKADVKEALFSGFFENNSEAQITNLRLGIDNWIYAANNGQRSLVTSAENPDKEPLNLQGADFRFRMKDGKFEIESGTAQFGQTFDDWGNKFFTQNTLHIQQAVIPRRYLERHGHLSSKAVNHNISDHELEMFQMTPPPYWRAERTSRRNQQYQEQNLDRVEYADKHFTGASGGTVYNGDAFPENFYGDIFTGDVAGNLVHRDQIIPDKNGPTFIATRAPEEKNQEFLAATDSWFRPVGFNVGPDGFLYLVDFYRQHIETPVSIPDDLKEEMDFMNGENHGRIFRILPKGKDGKAIANIDFSVFTSSELVGLLAHPNGWWRTTAQRLILEDPKEDMIPELKKLVNDHPDERAKVHALYLLEYMDALEVELVKNALASDHVGLVLNALVLAENFLELQEQIAEKTQHASPQVALQAILSLGNFENQSAIEVLGQQVLEKGQNKWFRIAILSSEPGSGLEMAKYLKEENDFFYSEEGWKKDFVKELSHILAASGEEEALKSYISLITDFPQQSNEAWNQAILEGLKGGMEKSPDHRPDIAAILEKSDKKPNELMMELSASL
ncbi:MAG: PVC-type heme-binding CxxCH protein [Cyclobacteriaceae bacterium]